MSTNAPLTERLLALLGSRRFYAAVLAVAVVAANEVLGLDEEQVKMVITTVSAWIIGDSVNKTGT